MFINWGTRLRRESFKHSFKKISFHFVSRPWIWDKTNFRQTQYVNPTHTDTRLSLCVQLHSFIHSFAHCLLVHVVLALWATVLLSLWYWLECAGWRGSPTNNVRFHFTWHISRQQGEDTWDLICVISLFHIPCRRLLCSHF